MDNKYYSGCIEYINDIIERMVHCKYEHFNFKSHSVRNSLCNRCIGYIECELRAKHIRMSEYAYLLWKFHSFLIYNPEEL